MELSGESPPGPEEQPNLALVQHQCPPCTPGLHINASPLPAEEEEEEEAFSDDGATSEEDGGAPARSRANRPAAAAAAGREGALTGSAMRQPGSVAASSGHPSSARDLPAQCQR